MIQCWSNLGGERGDLPVAQEFVVQYAVVPLMLELKQLMLVQSPLQWEEAVDDDAVHDDADDDAEDDDDDGDDADDGDVDDDDAHHAHDAHVDAD